MHFNGKNFFQLIPLHIFVTGITNAKWEEKFFRVGSREICYNTKG